MDSFEAQSIECQQSIGRVWLVGGQITLGTCFLIAPDYVLTCFHVVHDHKGGKRDGLEVQFEGQLAVRVAARVAVEGNAGADLSLLQLRQSTSLPPIPLTDCRAWGARFITFGYPTEHGGGGKREEGLIHGPTSTTGGHRRIELKTSPNRISTGFSGAPVFVDVDGAVCAIGCISETGSQLYPDAPSCTPLREFAGELREIARGSRFVEKAGPPDALLPLDESMVASEAGRWRLSAALAQGTHGEVGDDDVVRAIHAAVGRAVERARDTDDRDVGELQIILDALRAKYQALKINPRTMADRIDKGWPSNGQRVQVPRVELEMIAQQATSIAADLQRIPPRLLQLARNHGVMIHGRVLDGWCYKVAARVAQTAPLDMRPDRGLWNYDVENLGRLFASAAELLSLDIGRLSQGYERFGFSKVTLPIRGILVAIAHETWASESQAAQSSILVYALDDASVDTVEPVARLVARRTTIKLPLLCRFGSEAEVVYAESDPFVYRWDLRAPTPIAEMNVGGGGTIVSVRSSPPMVRCAVRNVVWHLDPDLTASRDGRSYEMYPLIDVYSVLPSASAEFEAVYVAADRKTICRERDGSVTMLEVGEAIDRQYPELLSELIEELSLEGLSADQWIALSLDQYLGSPIVLAIASLWPMGYAVNFLEMQALRPIRRPVVICDDRVVLHAGVTRYGSRTFLVVTFINGQTGEGNHKVAIWDVTDPLQPTETRELGKWHDEEGDPHGLAIVRRPSGGFDVYYVLRSVSEFLDVPPRLYRFRWPEARVERCAVLPKGTPTGFSLLVCQKGASGDTRYRA
jgi:hypothetical protein